MKTEASLLREIATASTLREQAGLVAELDALRARTARQIQDDRDLDWSSQVIAATLTPVLVHSQHTASTDWLDDAGSPPLDTNHVIAEAALWFGKTSAAVKEDADEFTEQARGQARRVAGAYGEQAPEAERAYLDYVAFLHRREGASGLPQIQQLFDAKDNPSRTPLPEDTFDTFEEPVDPMNVGVDEQASSYNAPLMNEILQEGGGQGSYEQPNGHGAGGMTGPSSPFPMPSAGGRTASLVDEPSLAVGHLYNLDQFLAAQEAEARLRAQAKTTQEMTERGDDNKCVNCVNGNHSGTNGTPGCRGRGCTCSNSNCGKVRNEKRSTVQTEAASSLPQIQQTVDVHDAPAPTPMPQDVMFPLIPYFEKGGDAGTVKEGSLDPRMSSQDAPASRLPFGKVADQFTTHGDPAKVVGSDNPEADKTHDGHMPNAKDSKPTKTGSKDFERAFVFARGWTGGPIVRKGSVEFEAGLYAGMAENSRANQQAWLDAHQKWAAKESYFGDRIAVHAAFTAQMAKEAGTTTDLETMEPGLTTAHPDGTTPINGPGTVPPLAGGMDPARPGGAAPYNGADPFSAPVAPDPGWQDQHGHARQAAFRATIAANLAAQAEKEGKSPVCRGCGEAFESRAVAEQAHGKMGCGTETGERGYEMRRDSEAW